MNNINRPDNICFHDSTITAFFWRDNSIEIELEGVSVNNKFFSVSLIIQKVARLLVDDNPVRYTNALLMEGDNAWTLELEIENNTVSFFVEWMTYATRKRSYKKYIITGREITILIGDEIQDP